MRRGSAVLSVLLLVPALAFASEDAALSEKLSTLARISPDASVARLSGLLEKSAASYGAVNDYRAVFEKQERSGAALGERETIFLKFEKPFKIFLHWFDTHRQGLQVLYERGKRDGKLAIHKPGLLLGLAPVVYLDQESPWVREGSESYDIEDAGIGTFLYDFSEMVLLGASENKIHAEVKEGPDGTSVDVSFPGSRSGGDYFAARVEAFFDAKSGLPVRMTLYDWDGKPSGIYEYRDLALNVGTNDPEFARLAQKKLYRLYSPAPQKTPQRSNFARTS